MIAFSAWQAVSPAIERTKRYLFRPFRLGTYLKLCLVAVLTGGGGGGGGNFANPGSHSSSPSHGSGTHPFPHITFTPELIAVIIAAAVIVIVLSIFLSYLITRLRFAFFHCLIYQTKEIRPGWRLYREQAMRFFLLSLVVGLVFLAVVAAIAVPFVLGFLHLYHSSQAGSEFNILGFLSLILPLIPVVLLVFLVAIAVSIILVDFMLPHMALENASARGAWAAVRARIAAEKGAFLFYAFLRLVIPAAAMMCLFIALFIPLLIVVAIGAVVGVAFHSLFAGASGVSAFLLISLAAVFVLAVVAFFVLLGIGLTGPISICVRNYALLFYGGRYATLGNILLPPPPPLPEPLNVPEPA